VIFDLEPIFHLSFLIFHSGKLTAKNCMLKACHPPFAGAHFPAAGQASHPSGGAATNTNKKTRPAW